MKEEKKAEENRRVQEDAMEALTEKRGISGTSGTFKINGIPEIETTNFN